MVPNSFRLSLVALLVGLAAGVQAQSVSSQREAAAARLNAESGGGVVVSVHSATGAARFVRTSPGARLGAPRAAAANTVAARQSASVQFLADHGGLFGVTNVAAELSAPRVATDQQGGTHLTFKQVYEGVPVFGAELKTHFDAAGNLNVVNGTFIPGISVRATPTRTATAAGKTAVAAVAADLARGVKIAALNTTLMVYREGLAKGVEGENHLAWEVEVGNRADVREFVYVDAHTGKVIDRISGIHEAKNRRAYDAQNATAPGPNYPGVPFWVEGQAFPTGNTEADNMIAASSEIYDLFKNAFGRDSFDGNGGKMDSIFNRGNSCPNASWNGTFISFCPGTTSDDVTAHEWGHAYTQYTDNLIYAWQPGALNEAYSDIWGETVDRINNRQTDAPDNPRSGGSCTVFTPNPPTVNITSPVAIAGPMSAGSASFGPTAFAISGSIVAVNDGAGTLSDGCETPFANAAAIAGKIALIDRGTCGFAVKAKNAQSSGAIGVIIVNNIAGAAPGLGGADASVTTPTLSVSQSDGNLIKGQLAAAAVTASLTRGGNGTDNSVRWLLGEDANAFGGAIRDMYTPTCYGNPGKVSDSQYSCGPNTQAGDNGGVHGNSGVPNHGYALLVDGGSYNNQTVAPVGLTKAAHLYFRAQSVYQSPASSFADHADALQQSCADLTGVNLANLKTGAPSGEVIDANDCAQVAKMALAVELRTAPSQCNFAPLLAQNPPAQCAAGTAFSAIAADNFEGGKRDSLRWLISNAGTTADFTARNWGVVRRLPGARPGHGIFAADFAGGTCAPGGDESGVMRLESPEITIPAGATTPRVSFDHWVATEAAFDGGNVKISVNGGAWTLVAPANFVYNPYNTTLASAAAGNTNPLAGQPAFTGSDGGSVLGSWGRSIINLGAYASPNDKIKLRFEMGTDGCGGSFGWYVDDVSVYSCQAQAPTVRFTAKR